MDIAVDFARPADDAGIRTLVARQVMPGHVRLTLGREPDFSLGCAVTGENCHVIVARSLADGAVVGVACRTTRQVFLNGREERIGYLGQLRIDERFRGRWLVSRGFSLLDEIQRRDPVSAYLTSIVDGNDEAKGVLIERRRPSFPHFRSVSQYRTCAIPLWRSRAPVSGREEIVAATVGELPELVRFLRRECARRHLSTSWTTQALRDMTELGLPVEDIRIARQRLSRRSGEGAKAGDIVGVIALWDQTAYKQAIVRGYSGWLKLLATVTRGRESWLPRTILPAVGEQIRAAYASLVCVAHDDQRVFERLLREVYNLAHARRFDYLVIGFDTRDPLLDAVRRYPHFSFPSRLYLASRIDGPREGSSHEQLDSRPTYVDVATL